MKPSLIIIDGSYLLDTSYSKDSWVQIGYVTRNLKFGTKRLRIPIVNTTQLKRNAGKGKSPQSFDVQEEFAFGGSFINDSDVAISLYQDQDMYNDDVVGFQFAKGRRLDAKRSGLWDKDLTTMNLTIEEYHEILDEEMPS